MKAPQPTREHEWLQQLVGEWTYEMTAAGSPAGSAEIRGGESVRSIGGLWVMLEGHGSMPDGSPAVTIMTLGYDPEKQSFTGTFIGSMMTYLWTYRGSLDSSGKVLTLDTEGPSMAGDGKICKYKDIVEIVDADTRLLRSRMLGDDGQWQEFMQATYRRK
ncbi:MAG: DUF1579 domain-containing protein [Acidobacteriota bacterium]